MNGRDGGPGQPQLSGSAYRRTPSEGGDMPSWSDVPHIPSSGRTPSSAGDQAHRRPEVCLAESLPQAFPLSWSHAGTPKPPPGILTRLEEVGPPGKMQDTQFN